MKKILAILLTLVLSFACCAMAEEGWKTIQLGTSGFELTIPDHYYEGEITAADTDDSQVAYYKSDINLVDFDVYQWVKAEGETLRSAAEEEAVEFGAELVETEINYIPVLYYDAIEPYDGVDYRTTTFLFENGDIIGELVFWMDGEIVDDIDPAGDTVEAIIDSLQLAAAVALDEGGREITLGTSAFVLTMPVNYVKGEMTANDTADSQVGYYFSEDSLIDFDVYQWTLAEGETLENTAIAEAEEFGSEAVLLNINSYDVYSYLAVEAYEDAEYTTRTVLMQYGDDVVEVVFWLDGDNAAETVDEALQTLCQYA